MNMKFCSAALVLAASASIVCAQSVHEEPGIGAVFVMTNSASHNEVMIFLRSANGTLQLTGRVATQGRGSGGTTDPLGSQGSLTLSSDHKLLFAVNAGSGSLSSFRVRGDDLHLADVAYTGGASPVAVAQWGDLVYVLNFAGNSNVVAFHLDDNGKLSQIPKSIRYLSSSNSGASSVAFTPDGKYLLVTEKLTNNIDLFPVLADGTLGTAVITKDPGAGLFDLTISPNGAILALEAGAGTISSFIDQNQTLTPLNSLSTNGNATCWNVVTPDGRWVYTANSASNSISGFGISGAGLLTAVPGIVVAQLPAGSTDIDLAVSADSKYLYSLNSSAGAVGVFKINANGTLTQLSSVPAFTPATGFNGIAAY